MTKTRNICISKRQRKIWSWVILVGLIGFMLSQGYALRETQQREADAVAEANFWQQLVEHSTHAVIVLDRDGSIVQFNPAAGKLFGVDPGNVIGYGPAWMMDKEQWGLHRDALEAAFVAEDLESVTETKCKVRGVNGPTLVKIRKQLIKNGKLYAVAQIDPLAKISERSLISDE